MARGLFGDTLDAQILEENRKKAEAKYGVAAMSPGLDIRNVSLDVTTPSAVPSSRSLVWGAGGSPVSQSFADKFSAQKGVESPEAKLAKMINDNSVGGDISKDPAVQEVARNAVTPPAQTPAVPKPVTPGKLTAGKGVINWAKDGATENVMNYDQSAYNKPERSTQPAAYGGTQQMIVRAKGEGPDIGVLRGGRPDTPEEIAAARELAAGYKRDWQRAEEVRKLDALIEQNKRFPKIVASLAATRSGLVGGVMGEEIKGEAKGITPAEAARLGLETRKVNVMEAEHNANRETNAELKKQGLSQKRLDTFRKQLQIDSPNSATIGDDGKPVKNVDVGILDHMDKGGRVWEDDEQLRPIAKKLWDDREMEIAQAFARGGKRYVAKDINNPNSETYKLRKLAIAKIRNRMLGVAGKE